MLAAQNLQSNFIVFTVGHICSCLSHGPYRGHRGRESSCRASHCNIQGRESARHSTRTIETSAFDCATPLPLPSHPAPCGTSPQTAAIRLKQAQLAAEKERAKQSVVAAEKREAKLKEIRSREREAVTKVVMGVRGVRVVVMVVEALCSC